MVVAEGGRALRFPAHEICLATQWGSPWRLLEVRVRARFPVLDRRILMHKQYQQHGRGISVGGE